MSLKVHCFACSDFATRLQPKTEFDIDARAWRHDVVTWDVDGDVSAAYC